MDPPQTQARVESASWTPDMRPWVGRPVRLCGALWAWLCGLLWCPGLVMADEPVTGPVLGALGGSLRVGPSYAGSGEVNSSVVPQFVIRWNRLTLSNGGPLSSRAGELVEGGVSAQILEQDRLHISASLRVDQGRRSDRLERLNGVHDIPVHLRGQLRAGWRAHRQWEWAVTWRGDLSGRAPGHGVDVSVLHEWRPEFLDHTRWRVSLGVAAGWLDGNATRLQYGVTPEDARRSGLPLYEPGSGLSQWVAFTQWRREIEGNWVAYGGVSATHLVGPAALSPITTQRGGVSMSVGLGRRF